MDSEFNHAGTCYRATAAEYWDEHGIDETDGVEVEVDVQAPLSAILSVRLAATRYARLKRIAKKRDLPITSMARSILAETLDEL